MQTKFTVLAVAALLLGHPAASSVAAEPIKLGAFFALSGPAANIGMPTKLFSRSSRSFCPCPATCEGGLM